MDVNLKRSEAALITPDDALLSFGPFEVDTARGTLSRDGTELSMRPKCFEVLTYLVRNHGRLVTKKELLAAAWSGLVVTDSSLPQCLVEIRRILGVEARGLIHTVPRRGYRLDAEVRCRQTAPVAPAAPRMAGQTSGRWWSPALALVVLVAGLGVSAYEHLTGANRPPQSTSAQPSGSVQPDGLLESSAARKDYLQGKYLESRRAPGDVIRAIPYFRRATELDPGLVEAWVGLASSIRLAAYEQSDAPLQSWRPEFMSALDRALALDPTNPEANIRAFGYFCETGDRDQSQQHLATAMRYGSDSALVQSTAAGAAFREGDLRRAVALATRAAELEPLSFVSHENLGMYHFFAGNPALARQHFEIARDINPAQAGREDDDILLQTLVLLQDFEAAAELAGRLPEGAARDQGFAMVSSVLGPPASRDQHIERLALAPSAASALRLAEVYGYLGHHDLAHQWLSSAVDRKQSERVRTAQFCDMNFASSALFSPFLANWHRGADALQRDRLLTALDDLAADCA